MGLILRFERADRRRAKHETVAQFLKQLFAATGNQETALSAIALVHGIHRANSPQIRSRREAFIQELLTDVPVHPFSEQIAFLAGRIDGEQQSKGIKIPFQDLLIGATAMHLGYAVVTANPRHFEMIPGLDVKRLSG